MISSAQVVETSNTVYTQDYTHLDDHTSPIYDVKPAFKPLAIDLFHAATI